MDKIILFIYLVLFPFGQLAKISIFNASDIIAFASLCFLILTRKKVQGLLDPLKDFFLIALFSLIYSIFNFKSLEIFTGALYLLRIVIYFYFFKYCILIVKKYRLRKVVFNSLIAISFATAVFGWFQYLLYPDLTSLKYLGWDDHLYRLVGTFLDPGFTSLIIVFGAILSFFKKKKFLLIFFTTSLAFTYSRAGYIALIISLISASLLIKKYKILAVSIIYFLILIAFLPKPAGEGVNLIRAYSINARFSNYKETFKMFEKSPVFGVGFNNICLAKKVYINKNESESHSCSGSDSSLLLVLATTGVVGILIFAGSVYRVFKNLKHGFYSNIFIIAVVAIFSHSLFVNSLFYPWIMGYVAILASLVE